MKGNLLNIPEISEAHFQVPFVIILYPIEEERVILILVWIPSSLHAS